jgi:sigma-B regulation protein RsbU (phosphoserine phosphatase)
VVRDLDSRNGTKLNGVRFAGERRLADDDVVTIAGWSLMFREVEAPEGHSTTPDHRRRVQDIAVLATRSGLELGDVSRQSRMLGTLTRAAGALVATGGVDDLLECLISHLLEAVPAERAAVALLEGDPAVPSVVASRAPQGAAPMAIDPAVAERVLAGRAALVAPRVPSEDDSVHSVLCAPLWFTGPAAGSDRVVGLVALEASAQPCPFETEHVGLVSAIVNLAASRLESVRLRAEAADRRRLEEDLLGAARIQASLLPEETPAVSGWDLAGSSRLCSAVGADYYDFALEGDDLLLALGDVAGKGLAAALCMAALRAAVRAVWTEAEPLPRLVALINDNLCQTLPQNRFATLFLARLDPSAGSLLFVNAGHAAPLVVPGRAEPSRLETGGTILGAFPTAEWSQGRIELGRGDVLVVLSDGVMDESGAGLSYEQVAEVVGGHRDEPARDVVIALLAEADRGLGHGRTSDDFTFIVLKRAE